MTTSNYSAINAMVDIIAAPAKALDWIRDNPGSWWWPMLAIIVSSAGVFAYYFHWVDMNWLVDEQLSAMPPEDRGVAEDGTRAFMTPGVMSGVTIGSIVFMMFAINAIIGVYLNLVTKVTGAEGLKFGNWFSLSVWAGFIGVLGSIAAVIVIFLADSNQISQQDLQPLSFNTLFVGAEPGDDWFNWANSLNLLMIWSLLVTSLGVSRWTNSSLVKGMIIAFLPTVLIFGIWAAIIAS